MKRTRNFRALASAARRLLSRRDFLYQVCRAIGREGVVGEKRNRLVLFLAGITKELEETVSVIAIAPSSTGKSNLLSKSLQLFPPAAVIELSSLSRKALAYTKKHLARKVFYLPEYKGGRRRNT